MVSDWSIVLIFMKIRQAKPLKLKLGIFYFFVNRDVDGLTLKYCVNFYENLASQTSKIKIRGFSIFFVNRDVDGFRLKYCVNFYENQASQTSKIKIRGFSIFLASGSSQGSWFWKSAKKLDQNRSISRASFVRKKGRISRRKRKAFVVDKWL